MPASKKRTVDEVAAAEAAAPAAEPAVEKSQVPEGYGQLTEIETEIWSEKSVDVRNSIEEEFKDLRGPSYEEDMMFSSDSAGYDEMALIEENLIAIRNTMERYDKRVKKEEAATTTDAGELAKRAKAKEAHLREVFQHLEGGGL